MAGVLHQNQVKCDSENNNSSTIKTSCSQVHPNNFNKEFNSCLGELAYPSNFVFVRTGMLNCNSNHQQINYHESQLDTMHNNNKNIIFTKSEYSTLRGGGGCANSKQIVKANIQIQNQNQNFQQVTISHKIIQSDFLTQLLDQSNVIIEKAHLAQDEDQRIEILIALQWFNTMKETFNSLCQNDQANLNSIDLIQKQLPLTLQSAITYLRSSGYLCLQVLQVCNDLCRVVFSFFMKNNNRFFKIEEKNELMGLISDFEMQLQIENSNTWVAGVEFEIEMIKAVIHSSPSNSDEGKQLFMNFMGGMVKSVLTMSPSDDLIDSLISGATFLYAAYSTNNLKKKYEVQYYFESLKWSIINFLRCGTSVKKILTLLSDAYKKYIENSKDWLLNFCWVNMISFLIQYRPKICKDDVDEDKEKQFDNWTYLMQNKYLNQLSFDRNVAQLILSEKLMRDKSYSVNHLLQQPGIKQLLLFKSTLITTLSNQPTKKFIFKYLNQGNQQKLDYLYELLTQSINLEVMEDYQHQVDEFEQLVNSFKQYYSEQKKQILSSKLPINQQQKNIKASTNLLINKIVGILIMTNKMKLQLELNFDKFQFIVQSIKLRSREEKSPIMLLKTQLQQDILTLSNNYYDKCLKSCQDLWEETIKTIKALLLLFIKIEEVVIQKKDQSQFIETEKQQFDQIFSYIKCLKICKNQFTENIKQLSEMKTVHLKQYNRKQIIEFQITNPFVTVKQLVTTATNCNDIEILIKNIVELLETLIQNKQKDDLSQILFKYRFTKQLLNQLLDQLLYQHQKLEEMKLFLQNNLHSMQFSSTESSNRLVKNPSNEIQMKNDIEMIYDLLTNQQMEIAKFYDEKEKKQGVGEKQFDTISVQNLISLLEKDQIIIKEIVEKKQTYTLQLQQTLVSLIVVGQLLRLSEQSLEKPIKHKEQIQQIYKENILKFKIQNEQSHQLLTQQEQQENESNYRGKVQQQEFLKSEEIVLKEKNEDEIFIQLKESNQLMLTNQIKNIIIAIDHCKYLIQGISENCKLYKKVWKLTLSFDSKEKTFDQASQIFESNINTQLKEHFAFFHNQTFCEKKMIDADSLFDQKRSFPRSIEILLIFIDQMQSNQIKFQAQEDNGIIMVAKSILHNVGQISKDFLDDQNYKVRQCFVINLLTIQINSREENIQQFCQENILQIWAFERDERVKAILKNTEMVEMQKKLFSSDLKSFSKRLQDDMQEKFNKMNDLEQKVNLEGDNQLKQQLSKELQQQQQDFEEYLDNINEMTSKLDITIQFLKEIKKELVKLKQKIEKLQESINEIGDDVRKLRGKTYFELLEIRKRKVLEQKQVRDLNSIYIQLKVQEWDPVTGNSTQMSSLLVDQFEDQTGEVNEFLQRDLEKKDIMLIRGFAGSGKSRAAGKIEEFLWEKRDLKQSLWIPIYVSLPSLKEPKFHLVDQALESEYYQFDKIQIREFKDAMTNKQLKVVLILDSYDEMKIDCIQSNLFETNRMALDLLGEQQNSKSVKQQLKVIITTRTEILTQSSYQTWFYGESLASLKEIELLGFDESQQSEYLNEYALLSVKKEIFDLYEFVKQVTKEKIDLAEFTNFWKRILLYFQLSKSSQNCNEDFMVSEQQAIEIISLIKQEKCFKNISKDQVINVHKKLIALWSKKKFEKLIFNVNIQNIMTSPFMMEIVVQVLPNMMKKYSEASIFKDTFIDNFINIKRQTICEYQIISKYENSRRALIGQNPIVDQEVDISEKWLKQMANKIWDQLEDSKLFLKFSLADKIDQNSLQAVDEINIVVRALVVKRFTVFDFYISFIEFYHQRQIRKLMELGRPINYDSLMIDLFNFSQSLALDLTIRQLTQLKYNAKGQLKLTFEKNKTVQDTWQDVYFNDFSQDGEYKKLIRSCILLTQKGSNHSFTHKSIQEFYVAKYLLSIFDDIKVVKEESLSKVLNQFQWEKEKLVIKQNNEDNLELQQNLITSVQELCMGIKDELFNKDEFNISTDNFKGVLTLIREEMKQSQYLKSKLVQFVYLSQISSEFIRAASNSIYLLSFNNDYLGCLQLKNIKISNTKLLGLSFYRANLENSVFDDVSISSCNFNSANLQNVQWTNMNCNELPYLKGHSSEVNQVLFSPDGQILVSCSSDRTIRFWKVKEGKEICKQLSEHTAGITSIALSSDGLTLASGSFDMTIRIWDFQARNLIQVLKNHTNKVNSVSFSPDNITMASGSEDKTIRLWNFKEGLQIRIIENLNSAVYTISFSPDGLLLASGGMEQQIRLWDVTTGKEIVKLNGHKTYVRSVSFSPDGQTLVSGSHDSTVRLWNLKTQKEIATLEGHTANVYQVTFSPEGSTIASSSFDQTIRLWDTKTGKEVTKFEGHISIVFSVVFSPDGQTLASGSMDSTIRLWDNKAGQEVSSLEGHQNEVLSVAFSPEGNSIASGSSDSTVRLWTVNEGKEIAILKGHRSSIDSVQFSPDGQTLASGSRDGMIKLWNIVSNKEVASLEGHKRIVAQVTFSHDGRTLASGSHDMTIIQWDISSLKSSFILKGHENEVLSVVYSPDDQILASGSRDKTIRLWDSHLGKQLAILRGHSEQINSVCFSPDGQLLASGGTDSQNKTIKLWNVKTKEERQTLSHCNAKSLTFSPDGSTLASCSWESSVRTIKLWNTSTWKEITTVEGHTGKVQQVAFSPNGRILASCSLDKTIRLWDLKIDDEKDALSNKQLGRFSKYPECYKIIARAPSIVATNCFVGGATIITKTEWNLQKLFVQKGAVER